MHKLVILVVTVVSIATLLAYASAENVERRQIVAVRVKTPPKIDGVLNDAVWEKTQPSEGFIQTNPKRGEPMNQQTSIRVLYDDDNIYFGFQCYDTEPEKVVGTEMRRDYEIWEADDHVGFVLDTYHDLRTAYYFSTNPVGAKVDSRVTDNGNFHLSWDAVWTALLGEIRKAGRRNSASLLGNCDFHRRISISGALIVFGQLSILMNTDVGRLSRQAISL